MDVRGSVVMVTLDALQTDGTVHSFAGTYTVESGVIVDADIRRVDSPAPEPRQSYPPGPPAGVPDVDCSDLPGPVDVSGGDPHNLDADGDGIGCEGN
ncbi:excalibur calcium-binding domain-containing protein [Streptomyces apocyni]|uniref:excalibur calcium-binding domain-containing protein n=1 Tax=Streptomyces apocyni TaxID=2654677 RepID=UPI0018D10637|nr:excalibur calcium-binding domain-containing protein [Streptomyces apocyni]